MVIFLKEFLSFEIHIEIFTVEMIRNWDILILKSESHSFF